MANNNSKAETSKTITLKVKVQEEKKQRKSKGILSGGILGLGIRKRGVKGGGRRLKDLKLPQPRSEKEFSRTLLFRRRRTFEKILQSQASPSAKSRARIMLEKLN